MPSDLPVAYRDSRDEDRAFILSTWMRSYKGRGMSGGVDAAAYYAGQRVVAERLLDAHGATIACADDDDDVIYGWVISDGQIIHYGYIKRELRNCGLEECLLSEAGVDPGRPATQSHLIPAFAGIDLAYDPYLLVTT
jgi:hypothetical protein